MSTHPYKQLPKHCFWRGSIGGVPMSEVDPIVSAKFQIAASDRVVTAGSCFAQHIAKHLQKSGFSYFVTETPHPLFGEHFYRDYGYGVFSARYGNIYTSRQLLQLLRRAYGLFQPEEDAWPRADGRVIDPFRPQIQPNGFASWAEYGADRGQHFRAIRRAIEELSVFVFTLGLTEGWRARSDGAVYPLCPGVAGGEFDAAKYEFINLRVQEVIADMEQAIDFIRQKNPSARILLTVSPVPLAATAEDRSVLVSTTLSKSVLRVASEEIARQKDYVAYFPSYEIVTGSFTRAAYFAEDLRSVTEAGVDHVMRLFMKHYAAAAAVGASARISPEPVAELVQVQVQEMQKIADVICEEEMLERTKAVE